MKGPGVAQLYAFIMLKRQNVTLDRDIILMAVPDEEVGGGLGATWTPTIITPSSSPNTFWMKAVSAVVISSRQESWCLAFPLRRRSSCGRAHRQGVAATVRNHRQELNDRLVRALARLLGEPLPTAPFSVLDTLRSRVGTLAENKFNNAIQHSTISITTLRARRRRAAEGERDSVGRRGDARLPRAARYH